MQGTSMHACKKAKGKAREKRGKGGKRQKVANR
jgi:hypothetical protein